jgi:hypothetical protein
VGPDQGVPAGPTQTVRTTAVASGDETRLADTPLTTTTGYVKQTAVAATAYAEFGFDDVTRGGCVNGVQAWSAMTSSATTAKTSIFENGTTETVVKQGDMSPGTATLEYYRKVITPASGTWNATKLSGLTARLGYASSVGSKPYWQSLPDGSGPLSRRTRGVGKNRDTRGPKI